MQSKRSFAHARPLPVSALATLLLIGSTAHAQVASWTGNVNNNWTNDSNWQWTGAAPTPTDDAVINAYPGVDPVLSSNTTIRALTVGGSTVGNLQINQATLNTSSVLIGNSNGSNGTITVTGSGTNGSARLNSSGDATVGLNGVGSLTLDAGAVANVSGTTYVGGASGGVGNLTINTDSSLIGNGLVIGNTGAVGTMLLDGGVVNMSGSVVLGSGGGSNGSASLVNGAQWLIGDRLTVGSGGSARLSITGGSTVDSVTGVIGTAGSTLATVNISGAGSRWTNSGSLFVGTVNNGNLTISAGANVNSANTVIGRQDTSNSSVSVSGAGSSLAAGNLTVGGDAGSGASGGTGWLTVSSGANATAAVVHLGDVTGARGTLTVDNANFTASDRLSIGYGNGASGNLSISNGGVVTDTGALVGHLAGSSGNVTVSGSGSKWINTGVLYVGNVGNGNLTISGGGNVTSTDGYVGSEAGSNSNALITGSGSVWNHSGDFFVGHNNGASGSVVISAGGRINDVQGLLGDLNGASGSMTVTGAGSTWSSSSDVNVGRLGNGTLTISDGGQVTGNRSYIANNANSNGSVTLTGANSAWITTNALHVGAGGNGTLTISDGARATASVIRIATSSGSTGTLNVGAAPGSTAAAPGQLDTTSLAFGAGNGTLNLNHNASGSSNYTLAAAISGNGTINQLAGETVFSGNSTSFTGSTNVNGGKLNVNGVLGGTVRVNSGGTLSGSGTVGSTTVAAGGTLATAGTSTLTVQGNLNLQDGATTQVSTSADGSGGLIQVNGNAALAGSLSIAAGSGAYALSTPYTIVSTTGTVSGSFNAVRSDFAFVSPTVSYTGNAVQLTMARNGNSYASVTTTGNQASVANALAQAGQLASLSSAMRAKLALIDGLSAAQARSAFESLGGRAYQGLSTLGLMGQSLQTLGNRNIGGGSAFSGGSGFAMSQLQLASAETDRYDYQYSAATMTDSSNGSSGLWPLRVREDGGAWAQVAGGHGNTRSDGNADGYTSNSNGLLMGVERVLDDRWSMGLAYHYDNTRLAYNTAGDSAKVEGHQVAVYAQYQSGDWRFKGIVGYGRNQYATQRSIVIGNDVSRAAGDYNGDELGLHAEASYRIDRGSYVFEPLVSLQGTLLRQDAFSETGAGALGLNASAQTSRSAVSMVGARWHLPLREDGKLQSELRAFWSHQWLDAGGSLNASFQGAPGVNFQVAGLQQKRDGLVLGAGLSGRLGQASTLFLDYNLGLNDLQTQHAVVAGWRYRW
ncbi:autotransporter domain-containing protein [Herbaspirillum frisingense]|uniref:autotransporter domain-containing protein n=1 Tax=Herbaspirillum frisingense TaxID=92645 RepID=UPI0016025CCF|nr:autotransporter domain-containing protein [Herbaspirillum frisingense]QNB08657.1 autotransporter domain-containing protein [Herbaspirillum frisingense]